MVNVRLLPSGSVPLNVISFGVSSLVVTDCPVAVGAAFEILKWAYASVTLPFVPTAGFAEIHGVGVPGRSTPESVVLFPLVHLSKALPLLTGDTIVTAPRRTDKLLFPNPGMLTVPPAFRVTVPLLVGEPLHVLFAPPAPGDPKIWKATVT